MAKKDYTFEELRRSIISRDFSPIYVLMGEESYFIDQLTDLFLNRVMPEEERDFNQHIYYGADSEVADVLNAVRRFPMMAERQLVMVREAQLLKDIEKLADYVKNPQTSTILVLCYKYKTLDRRKSLASAVAKTGVLFESKKIPEHKMAAFVNDYLKERKVIVDQKAAQMLIDSIGNDLNRLHKEMEKLAIVLTQRGKNQITAELIEEHIGVSKEYNNFELLRALSLRDGEKCFRIAQYYENNPKDNPIQKTLVVLFNYFSNLLIAYYSKDKTEQGIAAELGLRSSFMARDYLQGMKNYPPMKVFHSIGHIRTADARSKGWGGVAITDPELLKELLCRILR